MEPDETHAEHAARLERMYMSAIDEALNALDVFIVATTTGDAETAKIARERALHAWATFGEIIINRADHRTAHMLVDALERLRVVEQPPDDPTGFDAGRQG